ncbi:MAG: hypothetical protein K2Y40_23205 [Reyranella sp.]|nr:hypothetical protein [Reyranella sp.]
MQREILIRLVGWIAGSTIAMLSLAVFGWWFYLRPLIVEAVGGVPDGAVVAFHRADLNEDTCPGGWAPFKEGRGRFVIGVGQPIQGFEVDEGKDLLPSHVFNSAKGFQNSKLTMRELPPHDHATWVYAESYHVSARGRVGEDQGLWGVYAASDNRTRSSKEGLGESFSNLPPFIALYLCKKR